MTFSKPTESRRNSKVMKCFFSILCLLIFLGAGCSGPSVFKISKKQFHQEIKTIAVAPLQGLPEEPHATQEAKEQFASLIKDWVEEAGFSVVPPEKIQKIWNRLSEDEEYRFNMAEDDPETARLRKIRMQVLHEIGEKFGADAVIISNIFRFPLDFESNTAYWEDTSQPVGVMSPNSLVGVIQVISLEITIQDIKEGNELF